MFLPVYSMSLAENGTGVIVTRAVNVLQQTHHPCLQVATFTIPGHHEQQCPLLSTSLKMLCSSVTGAPPPRGSCGWGGGCIFSCATQTPLSCRAPWGGEEPGFLGLDSPGARLSFAPPSHLLGSPFRLSLPQVPQDKPPPRRGDEQPPGTRGL